VFKKVLVANRGAIALRIMRTLRRMGIGSVAVYSDPDAGALHAAAGDESIGIGGATAAESYLDADKILEAAYRTGAEAIIPDTASSPRTPSSPPAARRPASRSSARPPTRSWRSASSTPRARSRPRPGCRCFRGPRC
jgi:biotin carboxylase